MVLGVQAAFEYRVSPEFAGGYRALCHGYVNNQGDATMSNGASGFGNLDGGYTQPAGVSPTAIGFLSMS